MSGDGSFQPRLADRAGIEDLQADPAEMSRVLWCMEALELIENTTRGELRGARPNAWRLTGKGTELLRELEAQAVGA